MITDVTNVLPMLANVHPMVAEESSVGNKNPQKVAKIEEKNQKNRTNMSWQHCFRLKQPINYPVPWLTLVISATIGYIGYPLKRIGKHYWHWWGTRCIFGNPQQSWHRRPDDIGSLSQSSNQAGIIIGFHGSPNCPGLVKKRSI